MVTSGERQRHNQETYRRLKSVLFGSKQGGATANLTPSLGKNACVNLSWRGNELLTPDWDTSMITEMTIPSSLFPVQVQSWSCWRRRSILELQWLAAWCRSSSMLSCPPCLPLSHLCARCCPSWCVSGCTAAATACNFQSQRLKITFCRLCFSPGSQLWCTYGGDPAAPALSCAACWFVLWVLSCLVGMCTRRPSSSPFCRSGQRKSVVQEYGDKISKQEALGIF